MNRDLLRVCKLLCFMLMSSTSLLGQESGPWVNIDDQLNLALRQATHHLYIAAGDSTSRIAPVQKVGELTYEIVLGPNLDYDTLPSLLAQAFEEFGVKENYYVSVKSCSNNTIILGYGVSSMNILDPPCKGREVKEECTILSVTLQIHNVIAAKDTKKGWTGYLIGLGLLGLGLLFLAFRNSKHEVDPTLPILSETQPVSDGTVLVGATRFDPRNLYIEINSTKYDLTYRESKLLSYLVAHRNQILKRQDIQDHVWEDEGVIVGRSLDVFISRLRKLLKEDQSLKISNIHGVGYRLEEVSPSIS